MPISEISELTLITPESYRVAEPREIPRTACTTRRHALSDLRRGRAGTDDSADNPRRNALTQSNRQSRLVSSSSPRSRRFPTLRRSRNLLRCVIESASSASCACPSSSCTRHAGAERLGLLSQRHRVQWLYRAVRQAG